MRVNLQCSEAQGNWIYAKFVQKFILYSRHNILINSKQAADLTYCIPYYELSGQYTNPVVVFCSHQETREPLKGKFVASASSANMDVLGQNGLAAIQIVPGVDHSLFKQRSIKRMPGDKLIVGWVGRSYTSTTRKNEGVLQKLAMLPFVDLRITGGKVAEQDLPQFYGQCDIVVSPALTEGGPMSLLESLACGVPFLCFDDVGLAREFDDQCVLRVPFNDERAFVFRLAKFWNSKEYLGYYDKAAMDRLCAQVSTFTWESFVAKHDELFESMKG